MRNTISLILLLFVLSNSKAQTDSSANAVSLYTLGFEAQVYPTGYLLGLRAEVAISDHHAAEIRVGTNIFDHENFGVQEEEEGSGFGFTLGYRYYFSPEKTKWFLGLRSDFWWNDVDWKEITARESIERSTDVFVIQPTAIAGYAWQISDNFRISPTLAVGAEINAITNGKPTGEGAILLGGINLDYKF